MSEVPGKHPNDTLQTGIFTSTIGYDRWQHLHVSMGNKYFHFYFCKLIIAPLSHMGSVKNN